MSLLDDLINKQSDTLYFTPTFKRLIEEHLPYLINTESTQVITIKDYETTKFKGDFYGILITYNVPAIAHYATMRVNGMKTSSDYAGLATIFTIPSTSILNRLYSRSQVAIVN